MARHRRPHSIDGIRQPEPQDHKRLGDFSRPEGFKPSGTNITSPVDDVDVQVDEIDMSDEEQPRKRKRRFGFKGVFKLSAGLALLVVLFTGGFLFAKTYTNLQRIFQGDSSGGAVALRQNLDPAELKDEGDGRVNILVSGRGGPGEDGPDLTDTIILASIDPIAAEMVLLSIPRDMYVEAPGYGSMKINQVFFTGKEASLNRQGARNADNIEEAEREGLKLLDQTAANVLGVPIHYHGIISFDGFEKMVDTVGGIDVDAPSRVHERMEFDGQPYVLDVKPGEQHMDGFEALAYARSRYTSPRGDFDRSERQRLIILALKEKMLSLGTLSNPNRVAGILDDMGDSVKTNIGMDDIRGLQSLSGEINSARVISVGLNDEPNNFITTGPLNGLSVVMPSAGLGNYNEIQYFLRNVMIDSFIRDENPRIVVLNGSEATGAAQEKAEELRSYGYNVVRVDNAERTNYSGNQLIDLRGGQNKYTERYLELRLDASSTGNLEEDGINPGEADFVIIVGRDG